MPAFPSPPDRPRVRPVPADPAAVRTALVGDPVAPRFRRRRSTGDAVRRISLAVAGIAVVAIVAAGLFARFAPRRHDFAATLGQVEELLTEGRRAEAGAVLLARVAPFRDEANPDERARFEEVHRAWRESGRAAPSEPSVPSPAPTVRLVPAPPDPLALLDRAEALAILGENAESLAAYRRVADAIAAPDATVDVAATRQVAAGSALDRHDAMLAIGDLDSALAFAETAAELAADAEAPVVAAAAAVRIATARKALAERAALAGDAERARALRMAGARAAMEAEPLVLAATAADAAADLGVRPGDLYLLAAEAFAEAGAEDEAARARAAALEALSAADPRRLRLAPVAAGPDRASDPTLARLVRAERRREAGLAASRALLEASPEGRPALIEARLVAYGEALEEFSTLADASDPDTARLAEGRVVECLLGLGRIADAVGRLARIAEARPGSVAALEALARAADLSRRDRDAAAAERFLAAARAALEALPDRELAAASAPLSRAEWRRLLSATPVAAANDRTNP